jgi:hypothetical protein
MMFSLDGMGLYLAAIGAGVALVVAILIALIIRKK